MLWEMLDQLRYARTLLLAQFLVSWTILLTVPVFAAVLAARSAIFLLKQDGSNTARISLPGESSTPLLGWSAAIAVVLGVIFIAWAMDGREWRCLTKLGAHRTMPGECERARDALHEIALAAGLNPVPALYLIPDDESVNAVVLGRSAHSAAVAVTSGMAYRCPQDLQRAVFASLLSRFRNGGVGWTTVRYMLMEPISRFTLRYTLPALWVALAFTVAGAIVLIIAATNLHPLVWRAVREDAFWVIAGGVGTVVALSVVGWVLDASFRRNYAALVLSADAEGVALLREPAVMLAALKSLLSVNSWLAHADGLSYLAFVDPSRASTLECPTALDLQRLQLLEELAFPCPPGSVTALGIAPLEPHPDRSEGVATDAV